jgi:negative regulator of flagellin synthesis FlgM
MRIDGNELQNESLSPLLQQAATKAWQPGNATPERPAAASSTSDSAAISQAASLIAQTSAQPDLNAARVQQLRLALADGSFQVDTGRTASALMQTMWK